MSDSQMRRLTITAAEWASREDGTLWLVREGDKCSCPPSEGYGHIPFCPPCIYEPAPPVEFVQECAPCDRCEEGCDITMCLDCGEDYGEPCARHLTAGHHASADPYGDSVDCHACCPDCRIELVRPCPTCRGWTRYEGTPWCRPQCDQSGSVIIGYAYAVGQPLPITNGDVVQVGPPPPDSLFVATFEDGSVHVVHDADYMNEGMTATLAHYGPSETLVGKWALQLAVGS